MSEETTTKRERKDGDLNVFINNKREKDSQPVLWGKLVIDPKTLLEELAKNPAPDGMVELRVSLWGSVSKNGGQYWYGNAKPNQAPARVSNDVLPPGSVPSAEGGAPLLDTNAASGDDLPF
jgi:hypothetical protein